jgi:hypothetical protein
MEGMLHLVSRLVPRVNAILSGGNMFRPLKDEKLGHRPNPLHPEHDRSGFRNSKRLQKAEIIALGDSQTYGFGVRPHEAWPQQLESLSGVSIYNMSCGGYGPTHSLVLWEEALQLKPHMIIEALYAGNDMFDSFSHVYFENQLEDLKSSNQSLVAELEKLEKDAPIAREVSTLIPKGTDAEPEQGPRGFIHRAKRPLSMSCFLSR